MVETTVIILNYNGGQYLERCLKAALNQTYRDYEVLLVDNGSVDGSLAIARAVKSSRLRVIENRTNTGFAEGNNIGYRAAKATKFVVLLNNDTRVAKTWLARLVACAKAHPDADIVGTLLEEQGNAGWELLRVKHMSGINVAGDHAPTPMIRHGKNTYEPFYVTGNGMLFRKHDKRDIPFDPDYFAYAEDVYACWRARIRGARVLIAMDARMEHVGGGTKRTTTERFRRQLLIHGSKNQMMNFLLFYEAKNIIRVMPLFILGQLGHIIANPRRIGVKVAALWWIITHAPSIRRKRKALQAQRRVPDNEMIPLLSGKYFVAMGEYARHARIINALNRITLAYCRVVRLPVRELAGRRTRKNSIARDAGRRRAP